MMQQEETFTEFVWAGAVTVTHVLWRLTQQQEKTLVWSTCQASEMFGQRESPPICFQSVWNLGAKDLNKGRAESWTFNGPSLT